MLVCYGKDGFDLVRTVFQGSGSMQAQQSLPVEKLQLMYDQCVTQSLASKEASELCIAIDDWCDVKTDGRLRSTNRSTKTAGFTVASTSNTFNLKRLAAFLKNLR